VFAIERVEFFDRCFLFTQPRLKMARSRRSCHLVDGGLVETQRLYREQSVFHICTISVHISR